MLSIFVYLKMTWLVGELSKFLSGYYCLFGQLLGHYFFYEHRRETRSGNGH